jgi:Cu2+-exporting ATPase
MKKHSEHNHEQHEHSSNDHSSHHEMMIQDFRKRFFVSLALTFPILSLSPMIQRLCRILSVKLAF